MEVEGNAGTREESIAMGMQRYDAYYKSDLGDKLSAMLERSEDGDLVLYADAQERERVLREQLSRAHELLRDYLDGACYCDERYFCDHCRQAQAFTQARAALAQ